MNSSATVTILGKEYQVSCPAEQQAELYQSAKMLNDNMEKIRSNGKVVGVDRIAVIAALNMAHELLALQQQLTTQQQPTNKQLAILSDKIGLFLQENHQLEL